MRIGGRLLLLLAVPLVGLLAVTGYGVYSGVRQSQDASALQQRTDLALTTYALITDLQIERSALVDREQTPPEVQARVAAAVESISRQAAAIGDPIAHEASRALVRVDAAQRVDAIGLGDRAAMSSHSNAINRLLDLATMSIDPAGAIDAAPADTANNLARAQAASAEERDLVVVVSGERDLTAASFQQLTSLASAQRSYIDLAASTATPAMAPQIERVGHGIDAADDIRREVYTDPGVRDYSTWISGLETRTVETEGLQRQASDLAVDAVDDLASSSRELLVLAALAAVATLLITILLLRRAIGSIARPLEELAIQAEDVARNRLPEAVKAQQLDPHGARQLPVLRASGAAEVYELASAFNDVQDTALRLASEQAALRVNQSEALTNLGRRNQTLLARQLDFISSLETKETDPAFLEHLFRLDHLASRMRRNAESLLILAGSETPRRRRAPAQVSEVIRAAMSEVEEFERVRIGHLRDATLSGPVVIDLIHLLAEIIENALGFSPPDTTVEIDGRSLSQGGYQFAVIDHGVGMSDVEIVAANQRLAGLDELEGMPTRYLGQYVVAKLAAKTGVMVRLQPSSGGRGVTALVILPTTSVMGAPDRSTITSPLPGSKASREQGPAPFAPGAGVVAAGAVDLPSVIEASIVPDLRDARVAEPNSAPVARTEPIAEEEVSERHTAEAPLDAAGLYDRTTFDEPSYDEPAYDRTTFDEPSYDEPSYDEVTNDEPVADPLVAEIESVEIADEPDPWAQFSRSIFDTEPETATPETATPETATPETVAADTVTADSLAADSRELTEDEWWTSPPPAPESVPEQIDWTPFAQPVAHSELIRSEFIHPDPVQPQPIASESESTTPPVVPVIPSPIYHSPLPPTTLPGRNGGSMSGPGTSGPGGLSKRVPGASLAESRQPSPADGPTVAVDRSADGVRSMLSSFQAGRGRGRVTPSDEQTDGSSSDDTFQDGRSTR